MAKLGKAKEGAAKAGEGQESWDWPLGASLGADGGCLFALHAPAAERISLEIYAESFGAEPIAEHPMLRCADGLWRAKAPGLGKGTLYGYRAWGPNWPYDPAWKRGNSSAGFVADVDAQGNRFNPNKLLIDPYAREISHEKLCLAMLAGGDGWGAYMSGGSDLDPTQVYEGALARRGGFERRNFRDIDSGPVAPKSIAVFDESSFGVKPRLPPEDAIVYEAHVRGLCAHPSASRLKAILSGLPGFEKVRDVPEALRGTYAGAAFLAPYIRALGFTVVELLPVQETAAGPCPQGRSGGNFWGYMTAAYFAPSPRPARGGGEATPTALDNSQNWAGSDRHGSARAAAADAETPRWSAPRRAARKDQSVRATGGGAISDRS
jgi:isoamylase